MTRYPSLTDQYELFLALKEPGELTLDFLLEIAGGRYGSTPIESAARFDYPDELFQTLSPAAREGLAARFTAAGNAREKAFLAAILLAGADHEVFLALAQDKSGAMLLASSAGTRARKSFITISRSGWAPPHMNSFLAMMRRVPDIRPRAGRRPAAFSSNHEGSRRSLEAPSAAIVLEELPRLGLCRIFGHESAIIDVETD